MTVRRWHGLASRAWLVFAVLLLCPSLVLAQKDDPGGVTPQSTGCSPNPCPARASLGFLTRPPEVVAPETGNYSYQVNVTNIGDVSAVFQMICGASSNQLPCVSTLPSSTTIGAGATKVVTVTFRSLGLGTVLHRITARPEIGVPDTAFALVKVDGPSITTHAWPLDHGELAAGDTLKMVYSHPSGINTASVKLLIDGRDSTNRAGNTITSTSLKATGLNLSVGEHSWKSFVCAANGRCDSLSTSFVTDAPPRVWVLEDWKSVV